MVDDEPIELFLSKRFLEKEFQVEGFNSIPDAMQWAKSHSFEILISDYYLGGGLHAHDLLNDLIKLKGKVFRAFVITNFIDASKTAELKKAGFDGILEKPISLENFKKIAGF
jgi:DNA-binding NtrC family response regulator